MNVSIFLSLSLSFFFLLYGALRRRKIKKLTEKGQRRPVCLKSSVKSIARGADGGGGGGGGICVHVCVCVCVCVCEKTLQR